MISAEALYSALISMIDAADGDVFVSVFGGNGKDIQPNALSEIMGLAPDVRTLIEGYDYCESLAFLGSCAGKSSAFVAMKRKFEADGQRKRARKEDLLLALRDLKNSDQAYELVPFSYHALLGKIRTYLTHFDAKA